MSQGTTCPKCERILPPRLRRCFTCGARIYLSEPIEIEPEAEPAPRVETASTRPSGQEGLSEMQSKILLASWRHSRGPIYVCGHDHSNEGEVKSGDERFFGDEAVVALAGLVPPGLIVNVGDDCFTLTDDGARIALRLASRGLSPAV